MAQASGLTFHHELVLARGVVEVILLVEAGLAHLCCGETFW